MLLWLDFIYPNPKDKTKFGEDSSLAIQNIPRVNHIEIFLNGMIVVHVRVATSFYLKIRTRNTLLEGKLDNKEANEKRLHFLLTALCGLCMGLSLALLSVIFGSRICLTQGMLPF